ncbi:MAG TPA: extracellular solute-binding protein [Verrucomicrobiae bacterium]|nr:extracellular solute-binding protein [Verrucomicrobiae bacterium]
MTLRGITWNHTRGFTSIVATAQRYEELHPGTSLVWEKRSLQAFADAALAKLAAEFDLIIMDHPHTAFAATGRLLLPFEDWLPADFLADQAANSVGGSHNSYRDNGRQWTLATDAATPIATWRPDLIARHQLTLPQTWEDVIVLRPQFPGYLDFQDAGAPVAHDCIAGKTKSADAAREINRLYRAALPKPY